MGFGRNGSALDEAKLCVGCPENCLNCTAVGNTTSCVLCSAPFFLFEGSCKKRTNIGDTSVPANLSGTSNQSCSIQAPTQNGSPPSFVFSNNVISTTSRIEQLHYKVIVEFYLMRVGVWDAEDKLEVYLNDLLMLTKNYSDYGNKICSTNPNDTETDFLSF